MSLKSNDTHCVFWGVGSDVTGIRANGILRFSPGPAVLVTDISQSFQVTQTWQEDLMQPGGGLHTSVKADFWEKKHLIAVYTTSRDI